jgi:hypothetical protein
VLGARRGIVLAAIADAQTKLGSRPPGLEGARMMVDARQTYQKALDSFEIKYFNTLAMDIMDRRASRDLEAADRLLFILGDRDQQREVARRRRRDNQHREGERQQPRARTVRQATLLSSNCCHRIASGIPGRRYAILDQTAARTI